MNKVPPEKFEGEMFYDLVGFEGLYQISKKGEVKSLPRKSGFLFRKERILKQYLYGQGKYYCIDLTKDGKKIKCLVHRLVAINFIPNNENKEQVNHIDGNKLNNNVNNLEWCTRSENQKHAFMLHKNVLNGRKPKKIKQFSLENHFIKDWESIYSASKSLGINQGHVSLCCQGKVKQAGGFIWQYLE